MKTRGFYLFSAIIGPLLVVIGLASIFGLKIAGSYWLTAVLLGAFFILFGQRGLKKSRIPRETDPADMEALAQKRHRFWIFVAIASSLYAAGAYWLPATSPDMRKNLVVVIMSVTFALCVGIFLYSLFTRRKP